MSATCTSNAVLIASILNSHSLPVQLRQHFPNSVKSLSEHKLKRLSILTFINDNKTILFTKKAFKNEKEKIWRQVFDRMITFGMVSKEKDWRYVRDVSFSNWRKRAQKRLRCLSANGFCLNMDECEFLIHDILGKTPDKLTGRVPSSDVDQDDDMEEWNGQDPSGMQFGEQNYPAMDDDEDDDDEYMIDSNEEDDDDEEHNGHFDEMLFVPKVVFNEPPEMATTTNGSNTTTLTSTLSTMSNKTPTESSSCDMKTVNGNNTTTLDNPLLFKQLNCPIRRESSNNSSNGHFTLQQEFDSTPLNSTRYSSKLREMRLLDLEIENKLLKNRYMKLKVFEMEQNLGLDHCKEVKDLFSASKLKLRT